MHEKLRQNITFWGGTRTSFGVLLIGGFDVQEGTDHTAVALIDENNRRQIWIVEWKARVVLPNCEPEGPALVIGVEGEVASVTCAGLEEQARIDIQSRDNKFGGLLGGRAVAGGHVMVGFKNQVYFRDAQSLSWTAMDNDFPGRDSMTTPIFGLESIDEGAAGDWYAVGISGAMWRRSEGRWRVIESPTNCRLMAVHCADDGFVYAGGQHGTLLRGSGDAWRSVPVDIYESYIWDLNSSGENIYLATSNVLFQVSGGKCSPVSFSEFDMGDAGIPTSFLRLSRYGQALLSVGPKDVVELNDGIWSRIV